MTTTPTPADDAMDMAKIELAQAMVLDPDDLLGDVGPLAQLFYANQLTYHVLKMWAAFLSSEVSADIGDDDPPARVLAILGEAAGMMDQACVAMSILPPEAVTP